MATDPIANKSSQQGESQLDLYQFITDVLETGGQYLNRLYRIVSDKSDKSRIDVSFRAHGDAIDLSIIIFRKSVQIKSIRTDPGPDFTKLVRRALLPSGTKVSVRFGGPTDEPEPSSHDIIPKVIRIPKQFTRQESSPWGKLVERIVLSVNCEDFIGRMQRWTRSLRVGAEPYKSTKEWAVWCVDNCVIIATRIDPRQTELLLYATRKDTRHIWGYRIHADKAALDAWNHLGEECKKLNWVSEFTPLGNPKLLLPKDLDDMVVDQMNEKEWKEWAYSLGNKDSSSLEDIWLRYKRVVNWGTDRIREAEDLKEQSPEDAAGRFLESIDGEHRPATDSAGEQGKHVIAGEIEGGRNHSGRPPKDYVRRRREAVRKLADFTAQETAEKLEEMDFKGISVATVNRDRKFLGMVIPRKSQPRSDKK